MSTLQVLRPAAVGILVAIALSSCTTTEQPETIGEFEAPSTSSTTSVVPVEEEPELTPVVATEPSQTETTVAEPVPEHRRCDEAQAADGGTYVVVDIPADDPVGGLVVRMFAGTDWEARAVLPELTEVFSVIDDEQHPSCLITTDNSVWWNIDHPTLATGGWVNASYLAPGAHA